MSKSLKGDSAGTLWGLFLISLIQISAELYEEADTAINVGNYSDASLIQSQADIIYQTAKNLEIIIAEQEE